MKQALSLLALVALLVTACGTSAPGTPVSATITSPQSGAELVQGSPVIVVGRVAGDGLTKLRVGAKLAKPKQVGHSGCYSKAGKA